MRNRIYLVGETDCLTFCNTVNKYNGRIELVNEDGRYRVNAKSILGCLMASAEWGDVIYIESDDDLYEPLQPWIAVAADDAANIHE